MNRHTQTLAFAGRLAAATAQGAMPRQGRQTTRRTARLTGLLLLAAALGGCATPPPPGQAASLLEAQALQVPAAGAASPAATRPWPRQDWWLALADPQLNALIDDALAHGLDPAVADARLRQAHALAGVEQSSRAPQVSASLGWQGERQSSRAVAPDQGGGRFSRQWQAGLQLDWTPDLWGGRHAAWTAALGRLRAAEVSAQDARMQLSVAVAQAYMQLAYAHVQGDIAQAEQERVAEVQRLTLQRIGSGLGTQAQLRQTESDMASAARQRLTAQRLVSMAQSTLSVLLGQGPSRGAAISRPPWPAAAPLVAPSWLPLDLLSRRPDVVAARWQVEAARQHVASARAAFLPNLNLAALVGVASTPWNELLRSGAGMGQISPALNLPLFDGGQRKAGLALQEARYDEAVAHYNQTLVRAVNEVADQVLAQRSLAEQLAQQQRARDAASEAWQLAEQRYRAGVGSYLDALSVRQQLLIAEQALAALQAQRIQDGLQLVKALGGGFQAEGEPRL